jgi:hypothetical protein
LLDIQNINVEEVKRLCLLPPNRFGLGVSIFIGFVYLNFLSILETITMPLIIIDKSENFTESVEFLTLNFSYSFLLFLCVGFTAAISFFFYKNAIINQA